MEKKSKKIIPKKRAKGAGLKKGTTNNPNGRPEGALNKASASVKQIIAEFYITGKNGQKAELEKILTALQLDNQNGLELTYKISMAFKYLRFIAAFARDEQEVETETKIKNVLYEKFFNIKINE